MKVSIKFRNSGNSGGLVLVISLLALNSGCQKIAGWMTQGLGNRAAPAGTAPSAGPSGSAPSSEELAAKHVRNSQLLQELYRVVWLSDPTSPAEFGNWLDSIDQGASLEGVYNAFTRSNGQREREADSKFRASHQAVQVFSEQLALLIVDFKQPPEVATIDASALSSINPYDEAKPGEINFNSRGAQLQKPTQQELLGSIARRFSQASLFTLKRVLGDYALRLMAEKRESSLDGLKDWYAGFAARLAAQGLDYGLRLRSEPSREFHRHWADQNSEDLLRWEVLNRLHRVLNEAQKKGTEGEHQ